MPEQAAIRDIEAIQRIIPHRYPFLLVDRIVSLDSGRSITGIKNVAEGTLTFLFASETEIEKAAATLDTHAGAE